MYRKKTIRKMPVEIRELAKAINDVERGIKVIQKWLADYMKYKDALRLSTGLNDWKEFHKDAVVTNERLFGKDGI